jgi:hypothetical protein
MAESAKYILCPYCGALQPNGERCGDCGGLFEPLSRRATQLSMGPWYIRDKARPFRPGCAYEVLVKQVHAGKVKASSVIRGPTTRQFWAVARHVPGVAHLLGYCHRCGQHVEPTAPACPHCQEPFQAPRERNEMGLLYATDAAALAAQRQLEIELGQRSGSIAATAAAARQPGGASRAPVPNAPGFDLLEEVLGPDAASAPPPLPPPLPEAGPITLAPAAPAAPGRSRLLQFDESSAAALSPAPGANPAGQAQALDFTPSEDAADGAAAQLEPKRARLSLGLWLLIAVNVLLGIAVAVFIVIQFRGGPSTTGEPPKTPSPAAVDNSNSPGINNRADAAAPPAEPAEPPAPPKAPRVNPPAAPDTDAAPERDALPGTDKPAPDMAPGPEAAPAAAPPATEKPAGDAEMPAKDWLARTDEVNKLVTRYRYQDALAALTDLRTKTTDPARQDEIDRRLEAVKKAMHDHNDAIFEDQKTPN